MLLQRHGSQLPARPATRPAALQLWRYRMLCTCPVGCLQLALPTQNSFSAAPTVSSALPRQRPAAPAPCRAIQVHVGGVTIATDTVVARNTQAAVVVPPHCCHLRRRTAWPDMQRALPRRCGAARQSPRQPKLLVLYTHHFNNDTRYGMVTIKHRRLSQSAHNIILSALSLMRTRGRSRRRRRTTTRDGSQRRGGGGRQHIMAVPQAGEGGGGVCQRQRRGGASAAHH